MSQSENVSRRTFLQTGTALAATTAGMTAASYASIVGANDRIRVGFVGVGGMGSGHIRAISKLTKKNNLRGVAVADCWKTRAESAAKKLGSAKAFQDYRNVLESKEIDYVVIAVPEHWHAKVAIDAMDAALRDELAVEDPMGYLEGASWFLTPNDPQAYQDAWDRVPNA